jgi:hypothetical protein
MANNIVFNVIVLITFLILLRRSSRYLEIVAFSHASLGLVFIDVAFPADNLLFGRGHKRHCRFSLSVLNDHVESFRGYGLTRVKHSPEIIISLTSFPARIRDVPSCLYSLFTQTYKPDRVILFLSRVEFANSSVPDHVLKWQRYGLTIYWVDEDIKEYLKLLPALRLYPRSLIVTVDDDTFYPSYLIERLVVSYHNNPRVVHAHRAGPVHFQGNGLIYRGGLTCVSCSHPIYPTPNYLLVAEGVCGVLYPPGVFPSEVFNQSAYQKLCPWHDDIWFFAMRAVTGIPVQIVQNEDSRICILPRNSKIPSPGLLYWNWLRGKNAVQLSAVAHAYSLVQRLRNLTGRIEK